MPRRKRLKKWLWTLVPALTGLILAEQIALPRVARAKLLSHLRKSCPACQFEIGELKLGILTGRIEAREVKAANDPQESPHFDVRVAKLSAHASWLSLLRKKPHIEDVRVDSPMVLVSERKKPPENKKSGSKLPELRVDQVQVRNGSFRYEMHRPDRTPSIDFAKIDADAGRFDSVSSDGYPPFSAELHALGAQSGELTIRTKIWLEEAASKHADVIEIRIQNYSLAQANTFFLPEERVELAGKLLDGQARVELKNWDLHGHVTAAYRDLSLSFQPGPKEQDKNENPVSAKLKDVAANVSSHKTQPEAGKPAPGAQVTDTWDGKKGIVGFILKALGEGAQEIMKG